MFRFTFILIILAVIFSLFSCGEGSSSGMLCQGTDCSVSLYSDNIFKIVQYSSERWSYFSDNKIKKLSFNHLGQSPLYISEDGSTVVSKNLGYSGVKLFIFKKDILVKSYILPSTVSVLDSCSSKNHLWFLFKSEDKENNSYFISRTDFDFTSWDNYFISTARNYTNAEIEYMAKLRSVAERTKDPESLLKLDMLADESPFNIQAVNDELIFSTLMPRGDRIQINLYSLDIEKNKQNFISSYINAEKSHFSIFYEKDGKSLITYFSQNAHTYLQKGNGFPVEIDSLRGMDISFLGEKKVKALSINEEKTGVSVKTYDILVKKDNQ